jgi:hypothetical protein
MPISTSMFGVAILFSCATAKSLHMRTETCWQLSADVLGLGACAAKQNGYAKHACFIDIYFSLNKRIITRYEAAANVLLHEVYVSESKYVERMGALVTRKAHNFPSCRYH